MGSQLERRSGKEREFSPIQRRRYEVNYLLECLDHSPACSPYRSMQTAVFLSISCLLASSLLIHGSFTHGSHT